MKKIVLIAMGAMMWATSAQADDAGLPEDLRASLAAALATENAFVISATVDAAKAAHPGAQAAIDAYMNAAGQLRTPAYGEANAAGTAVVALDDEAVAAQTAVATPAPAPWWHFDAWEGQVEAGANIANGNTDRRAFNGGITLEREVTDWVTKGFATARMVQENDVRTEEEYRVGGEVDYKLDDRRFVFGDVEYVNDPFSGFDWRVTETVGYGHKVIARDNLELALKAGVGARHSDSQDPAVGRQNEGVFKPEANLDWQITEVLSFSEALSSVIGREKVITRSVTALKSKMAENLFLQLGVDMEHTSDVPAGTKHTDTTTSLNLVYEF